jgi:putative sterol carrier protein
MADAPSLDSIANSFAAMKQLFVPSRAANVDKTIQFNFSGREAGAWYVVVRNGTFDYAQGATDGPNTTVTADSEDWLRILRRELDPTMAFMTGKLKIAGDVGVMLQFQGWFDLPR